LKVPTPCTQTKHKENRKEHSFFNRCILNYFKNCDILFILPKWFFWNENYKITKSSANFGFSKKNIISKKMPNMNLYDKHNVIWWVRINARKVMIRENFIKQQDIAHLDPKHKRWNWCLHKNSTISLCTWPLNHPNDVFYFQDVNEVNEIHVPFTIRI